MCIKCQNWERSISCNYEFLDEKFQHAEYFYMVFISRTLAAFFKQCKYTSDIEPNNNDIHINYKTKSKYKKYANWCILCMQI